MHPLSAMPLPFLFFFYPFMLCSEAYFPNFDAYRLILEEGFRSLLPGSSALHHVSRLLSWYHLLVRTALHLQLAQPRLIVLMVVVMGVAPSCSRHGLRDFDGTAHGSGTFATLPRAANDRPDSQDNQGSHCKNGAGPYADFGWSGKTRSICSCGAR